MLINIIRTGTFLFVPSVRSDILEYNDNQTCYLPRFLYFCLDFQHLLDYLADISQTKIFQTEHIGCSERIILQLISTELLVI